ncbi:hypothetical protein NOR53_2701 [gamma proteobacterium NOR5-3]|nr:hypothetical protein NOR53_2701 [gamma proteobacterium NOR5-3]
MLCLVASASLVHAGLFDRDKGVDAQRAEIQEAREEALTKLYAEKSGSGKMLAESKGYAVFSNIGVNLFLISTQHGSGVLRDNRSAEDVYLKMLSGGGGIGLGVKNFAAIFVFHTDAALDLFLSEGWDFSAQADANMETDTQGDGMETAYTAMPGTTLYQLTDAGVAAQVTLQGTKFWRDEDLN